MGVISGPERLVIIKRYQKNEDPSVSVRRTSCVFHNTSMLVESAPGRQRLVYTTVDGVLVSGILRDGCGPVEIRIVWFLPSSSSRISPLETSPPF